MSRSMTALRRWAGGLALALLLVLPLAGCKIATIRPIGEQGKPGAGGQQKFDPVAYVDGIWESRVLPDVVNGAVDLADLLEQIQADAEAAKAQYGRRQGEGPWNFMVKGQAQVVKVDTSSRSRTAAIDVTGDGEPDAFIQVGPVIRGTSLRDAMDFIQFNQFVNQIEYADVSNELNDRVIGDVIGDLDVESLQGRRISFHGVFTLETRGVFITPVQLVVEEQG